MNPMERIDVTSPKGTEHQTKPEDIPTENQLEKTAQKVTTSNVLSNGSDSKADIKKVKSSKFSAVWNTIKQPFLACFRSQNKTETLEIPPPAPSKPNIINKEKERETDTELSGNLVDAVLDCKLGVWYQGLREYTFPSNELQITKEDMAAMLCIQNAKRFPPKADDLKGIEELRKAEETYNSLEKRLDVAIAGFNGKAFVKLETRSPKDAIYEIYNERLANSLRPLLSELPPRPNPNPNKSKPSNVEIEADNDELIAFYKAGGAAMAVKSGKEALDLLLSSLRVNHDLRHMLERFKTQSVDASHSALVVRGWQDIPLDREFRLFVHKGQLTGAAQYFHMCHFPRLVEQRADMEKELKVFWEKMKPLVPAEMSSYIMDIAFTAEGKPFVIELNPFSTGTGAPFYGWKPGSEGRARLLNGPYELRVLEHPVPNIKDQWLVPVWEKFINRERVSK